MPTPVEILLIYDKDCPVCNAFSQVVRIRQSVGELTLINARENSDIVAQVTAKGFNIDQAMVLKIGDSWYSGADAMHMLALISSQSGWFNRLNYWLFKSPTRAKYLYPMLRGCRNLLLKLLGKSKINNLGSDDSHR